MESTITHVVKWRLLRLGLGAIVRPKEQAENWAWLVDHTVQIGKTKCLLIVGIRPIEVGQLGGELLHHDLEVIAPEPVEDFDGATVCHQLQEAARKNGSPRRIVSDHGSDSKKDVATFQQQYPHVSGCYDIAHKVTLLLKKRLEDDARRAEFTHVDTEGPANLQEKLGWVRSFAKPFDRWSKLMDLAARDTTQTRPSSLRGELSQHRGDELRDNLIGQVCAFVCEQSALEKSGERLLESTAILESLIGAGKQLEAQQSKEGFTKMVLSTTAATVVSTTEQISTALRRTATKHVFQSVQSHLLHSLQSQRRAALKSVFSGTKSDNHEAPQPHILRSPGHVSRHTTGTRYAQVDSMVENRL